VASKARLDIILVDRGLAPSRERARALILAGQVTVDGQVGMPLRARDSLRLQKASSAVRLVLPGGNTFFKVLREKLKWG